MAVMGAGITVTSGRGPGTARGSTSGAMEKYTKGSGNMARGMVVACGRIMKAISILVNGPRDILKALVFL